MKVLSVSGKFLSQPTTGVQRYAAGIVSAWDQGLEEGWIDRGKFTIRLIVPHTLIQQPNYKHVTIEPGATNGRTWEQIELPWKARGTLLFSPYAAAPLLKLRHTVTIHDAAAAASPEQYTASFRVYCAVVFRSLGFMCNPIFTVSEFSSHELQRYFSIPPEKIRVVYPGCDHLADIPPDDKILKRAGLETGKFVLAVSSQSTVKNFHGLSQAWAMLRRLDMKLAIAGRNHTALFRDGNESITENVVMLGYVSDPELRSLYENASLFVYPSFYEGFGIPPVEAMSCGCPVLVARIPSLMEACGDAAVFCDPADISDIAENIARLLDDSALAKRLRESGFRRASQLTAARTAATLWSEIQSFI